MTTVADFQIRCHHIEPTAQPTALFHPIKRPYFSVLWFRQGCGRYFVDFTEYCFRPNTIVLLSKDQLYYFAALETAVDLIELAFTPDFISRASPEIVQLLSFCIREHFAGKQILRVDTADNAYLHLLVEQMQRIDGTWTGYEQKASLFHWLQLFLIYCNKLKTEQSASQDDDTYVVVGNFTTLIERNFKQTQKVTDYCDQLYLTYNTLARYTQSYCGKSPKEIIAERVTLEAKRLLATSAMPVKEIAYTLGFDEPTNLVKYFKKQTGFTPTAFRENFTAALN